MSWVALAVVLAGGLGSVARFVVDGLVRQVHDSRLPWATLLVNLLGSALLGWLVSLAGADPLGHGWLLVLGTGFCGGFTTLSTTSIEVLRMMQDHHLGLALVWLVGQALLCLAVVLLLL